MMKGYSPHEKNLEIIKNTVPSMRYDGSEFFGRWQKNAEDKLRELLGLPLEKCSPCFEIEYSESRGEYTEMKFSFQSEENCFVPCYMLIPNNVNKPMPLMICLQGHSTGMHISIGKALYENDNDSIKGGDRDFAIQAVSRGFCAVAMEQRCMGERGGTPKPDCYKSAMASLLVGRTAIGERVWDVSRLIDVVEREFPQVDSERIYCMGNSGGGTTTFYATCLDLRIKGAMPSCALCTYEKSIASIYHCACNFIPNISTFFDMSDLSGLIAPRALVMVSGEKDSIFPIDGAEEFYKRTEELYRLSGSPDNCKWVVGSKGHRFYANEAWPVFLELTKENELL